MPLVDTIRLWAEGVEAADRKDFRVAFAKFEEIMEPSSKIYFNIGCISMTLDRLGDAVRAFDRTIAKDEHLAVAFFQRGAAFLRNQLYEEALRDFQEAHKRLRGNTTIDYEQLGLAYKLHLCVVLHNVSLAHASLGQWVKAQEMAQKAKEAELQPHQTYVDRALEAVKRQEVWEVCAVPCGVMFRPQKQQVEQLGKKDYLGKATVVASLSMNEDLPEITSQQPQVSCTIILSHRACVISQHVWVHEEFSIAWQEITHSPAGIPVLWQRWEGWAASAVTESASRRACHSHANARSLPARCCNVARFLSGLNRRWVTHWAAGGGGSRLCGFIKGSPLRRHSGWWLQGGKKRNLKIPAPPAKEPPPRPHASEGQKNVPQIRNLHEVSLQMPITVELHFTQTVTMRARPGMSYADFLALISEKVKQPEERLQLSYRMEGSGDSIPMTGDVQMQRLWDRARNGKLTLCCQQLREPRLLPCQPPHTSQPGEAAADERVLRRVVALCDYDAKEPGDLGFREGDIIRVISEVNANWLEGRCRGNVGIFPTSFV
uniref:Neutrophil cytosolic factor 2 n=1 Tax=Petromyzon marinus TaxID=7757 RepID=S4RNC4_PETMA